MEHLNKWLFISIFNISNVFKIEPRKIREEGNKKPNKLTWNVKIRIKADQSRKLSWSK